LMKESGDCKDLLIEALKFHLRHDTVAISATRTRPRQPLPQSKLIMLVGGQAPKAIVNVDLFDVDSMRWTSVADLPQRRCRCGLVELHGAVYAIGGFNGSSRVRSVDVFDVVRNMWSTGPAMEARRSTLGVAVLTELQLIMAVGGFDGSTGLASAEALDPRQGHWMPLASMTVRRSSVGVSALNGYTSYAVGGYDGHSRQCLNTVEVYDARANRWRSTGSLNIRRSGAGVTVLEGRLVAVGGHDGPLVHNTVEVLSEKNTWDRLVDMSIRRRNAAVVACTGGAESQLLAIGGDDGALNLSSIESLVMDQSAWTSLPANMSLARSYAGATLINKF